MVDKKRVPTPWLKVIVVGFGLCMLGLISATITMRWVINGHEVKVPPLVGKDIVYALETLNELGLGLKITEQEFDPAIPENHIIAQQPSQGGYLKKGRSITVTLSKGSLWVWAPALEGDKLSIVQLKLKAQRLKIGRIIKVHHSSPSDRIVTQYPASNTPLARGSQINLLVSQGEYPPSYVMPDLIGLSLSAATIKVKGLGLEVAKVTTETYPGAANKTVINQAPHSGYQVVAGGGVELVVSEGGR